jgi:hypothetical protein
MILLTLRNFAIVHLVGINQVKNYQSFLVDRWITIFFLDLWIENSKRFYHILLSLTFVRYIQICESLFYKIEQLSFRCFPDTSDYLETAKTPSLKYKQGNA